MAFRRSPSALTAAAGPCSVLSPKLVLVTGLTLLGCHAGTASTDTTGVDDTNGMLSEPETDRSDPDSDLGPDPDSVQDGADDLGDDSASGPVDGAAPPAASARDAGAAESIGERCGRTEECAGVAPVCELPKAKLRVYKPPANVTGVEIQPIALCQSDADCTADPDKPYCLQSTDPAITHACFACRNDDDCELGSCQWGVCFVQCETTEDCGRPELYSCVAGLCQQNLCASDDDCPANTACDVALGSCQPRSCATDGECDIGTCLQFECSALPGRCIDPGALDPDPPNCVCGEGRICVTTADPRTRFEVGPRHCEPLPEGCEQCSCAQFVLCPQEGSCDSLPARLTCSPWVQ